MKAAFSYNGRGVDLSFDDDSLRRKIAPVNIDGPHHDFTAEAASALYGNHAAQRNILKDLSCRKDSGIGQNSRIVLEKYMVSVSDPRRQPPDKGNAVPQTNTEIRSL